MRKHKLSKYHPVLSKFQIYFLNSVKSWWKVGEVWQMLNKRSQNFGEKMANVCKTNLVWTGAKVRKDISKRKYVEKGNRLWNAWKTQTRLWKSEILWMIQSIKILQNQYLFATFGFDTAENPPYKIWLLYFHICSHRAEFECKYSIKHIRFLI